VRWMQVVANDRGMAVEYLILTVLVALGAVFLLYKFGGTVRGRVDHAGEQVARVGPRDGSAVPAGQPGAATAPEAVDQAPPALQASGGRAGGGVDVLGFRMSLSMAIWLGILFVVMAMLMVMRASRGAKAARKAGNQYVELARRVRGDDGQAMLEFFFAALIGMMMILGIIQVALMFNAKSMVKLAAFNAARAAIVARDPSDPTRGVRLAEMRKKARNAAFITLLPVIPALHGKLPAALTPQAMTDFVDTNTGLGSGGTPDTSALAGLGGAVAGVAYEFMGKTIDEDLKFVDCIQVDFVDPRDRDPVKPRKLGPQWPNIEFDDPGRSNDNVIKVMVTWHYPLVVPFINRIITAVGRPNLYRLALAATGSQNTLNPARIQPWATGFALHSLSDGNVLGLPLPASMAGVVQSVTQYALFRVPIRETYVMRMQWDRRP
jgi:Flp pilus assembly pilin Flp